MLSPKDKFKEIDGSITHLEDSLTELKKLLKSLQQVCDSLSDDRKIRDAKIGTFEENLKDVTKLLKEVQVEQQQLKDDQAKLRSESTKDAKEFKAQVGSLTTSICTTKKELQQEQQRLAKT